MNLEERDYHPKDSNESAKGKFTLLKFIKM